MKTCIFPLFHDRAAVLNKTKGFTKLYRRVITVKIQIHVTITVYKVSFFKPQSVRMRPCATDGLVGLEYSSQDISFKVIA